MSLSTPTRPCSSVSVLVAAAFGPAAGSAASQVRPGNSRAARIKTRAAAMPLAAPWALDRLQEHRIARTARLHSVEPLLWLVLSACREHQASRSLSTPTRPCSSVSVRVAAAFGPAAGSAACQVRPGNSRAACIKTRAAAMPLAAPLALGRRLQEHRVARAAAAFAATADGVC